MMPVMLLPLALAANLERAIAEYTPSSEIISRTPSATVCLGGELTHTSNLTSRGLPRVVACLAEESFPPVLAQRGNARSRSETRSDVLPQLNDELSTLIALGRQSR